MQAVGIILSIYGGGFLQPFRPISPVQKMKGAAGGAAFLRAGRVERVSEAGLLVGYVTLEIGVGHVRQAAIDPTRYSFLFAQRLLQGLLGFLMAGFTGKLNERL